MTTVGYGDITPSTSLGRVVAIVVMLVGIGFLTLVIGAVSQRFLAGVVEEEIADAERELEVDVDRTRAQVLGEIRAIAARLREIEASVDQLGR